MLLRQVQDVVFELQLGLLDAGPLHLLLGAERQVAIELAQARLQPGVLAAQLFEVRSDVRDVLQHTGPPNDPRIADQRRDFIYVDDTVAVMRWLLDTPSVSGIFNVGTGKARSFRDLVTAMFRALGREPAIEYVDMPAAIRRQYQYFTQAKVENLRRAGYNAGFTPLEEGVNRYVTLFLNQPDRYR